MKQAIKAILISIILSAIYANSMAQPVDILNSYFDAIKCEDYQKAKSYWDAEYILASSGLGIEYRQVPAKYDLASPIFNNFELFQNGYLTTIISKQALNDNLVKLEVDFISASDSLHYDYYAVKKNDNWNLTSLIYHHCRNWKQKSTRYFNIYYDDESRINSSASLALDKFVDSVGVVLKFSNDDWYDLTQQKIKYYLCNGEEMEYLTGYNTKGMADLAFDAVISQEFPHEHELAHLLINFKLKDNDLYTMPFLQEGLACHLGGRWGRSPAVIHYAGYVNMQFSLCQFEDILTYNGFYRKIGSPDISYPVSSLFVNFLTKVFGVDNFITLYRQLSGSSDYIQGLTTDGVKGELEKISGNTWENLMKRYDQFWPRYVTCGISPSSYDMPNDTADLLISADAMFAAWNLNFEYLFEIDISNCKNGCLLLLTKKESISDSNYISSLYSDHRQFSEYNGEDFGIKITASEVGIYDYKCNRLITSFVSGFSPEFNYTDSSGIVRVIVSHSAFSEDFNNYDLQLISF